MGEYAKFQLEINKYKGVNCLLIHVHSPSAPSYLLQICKLKRLMKDYQEKKLRQMIPN